jgi:hypothetical protein
MHTMTPQHQGTGRGQCPQGAGRSLLPRLRYVATRSIATRANAITNMRSLCMGSHPSQLHSQVCRISVRALVCDASQLAF